MLAATTAVLDSRVAAGRTNYWLVALAAGLFGGGALLAAGLVFLFTRRRGVAL